MKKTTLLILFLLLYSLFACKKDTPLHHLIHEADVVWVYIYSGNQLAVKYATNDIDKIKQWDNFIADDTASAGTCSYEGRIVFKVYEDSTEMKFSLQPGCRVVIYTLNNQQYVKSLTADGLKYLDSLKKIE